jgi:hypothetical protein
MAPRLTNVDAWLEEELRRGFVPFKGAPLPAGSPYRDRRSTSSDGWFAAGIATRVAAIVVAATCGLMATGALAAAAATGTADPEAWTFHLTMAISTCAGQRNAAQGNGIGTCLDAMVHNRGLRTFEQRARDGTGNARSLASPLHR